MLRTVAELKYSVAGLLSGIDLANVDDLNGCLERAASTLIQKAYIPEASGLQNLSLFSGVFDYACDTRIFGTQIIDIRPQGISRSQSDYTTKLYQDNFDRNKNNPYPSGTTSTFQFVNGVPIIRITAPYIKPKVLIDSMSSTTGWVASGSSSGLTADYTDFYQSPASIRFTLTGNSTGLLTKAALNNSLSISSYQGVGTAFLAIQIPTGATANDLTGITLKLGSDNSNYNTVTATTSLLGTFVSGNWVLVSFDFAGASTVGTPSWSAINYVQVSFAHSSTMTNFRVGNLFISLPSPSQILYQSAAIYLATGSSNATVKITAPTDTIILTDSTYNIYLQECALAVLQNTGAGASDATSIKINNILHGIRARNGVMVQAGLYDLYKGINPSESTPTVNSWYDNSSSYNQLI